MLRLDADGEEIQDCINFAKAAGASLPEIDLKARRTAAAELLATYNEGWRHYNTTNEQGESIDVSEPELSEPEFLDKLTLRSVAIYGTGNCCLAYDCGSLFWGHSIFVDSFDGTRFSDMHSQLVG